MAAHKLIKLVKISIDFCGRSVCDTARAIRRVRYGACDTARAIRRVRYGACDTAGTDRLPINPNIRLTTRDSVCEREIMVILKLRHEPTAQLHPNK